MIAPLYYYTLYNNKKKKDSYNLVLYSTNHQLKHIDTNTLRLEK